MKVFVKNKHGKPLMPCSARKARILLKRGVAKVVRRSPFTIELKFGSSGYKQDLTLGVDTGHSEVGISAVSSSGEFYSVVVKMRNDISEKMTTRKMYRRNRRNRLRYRKARFNNRAASTRNGRLAPSVQWKVDAHIRLIEMFSNLMPISKLILETGTFDPHKLKNPNITNKQYQKGVQYGFENVKAYVLSRDRYKCQCGKSGCSKKLEVHHIIFRSNGGSDSPDNLITLCSKHHDQLHKGKLILKNIKKHKELKSATTMNVIRKRLLKRFPSAIETFGYVTKSNRYKFNIEKSHSNDAFVIAGGSSQKRCETKNALFKRKNNRCLQKNRNGFSPSIRRRRYKIQPKDIIKWNGRNYIAQGMQNLGKQLKFSDGIKSFVKSIKQINIVFHQKGLTYL